MIGSGPAGLTAANYLALKGHSVTVFETQPKAGGMLRVGIPNYRLPENILDAEIANLREALAEQLDKEKACYFGYEEDAMYTQKESQLIQQYLQEHGRLPEDNDELDDLF